MNDFPAEDGVTDVRGGLRERKRAQTSHAIHRAAAELVLERGFDATTIDAISERADVSTRTFFNYFPSKEDAVLGIDEMAVSAELDKVRPYDGDLLIAVFDLIYDVFAAGTGGNQDSGMKRKVLLAHPQLMTRRMVRIAELEDRLSEIISGWLAEDERFASDSDAERRDEAHLLLGICLATVRVSVRRWAGHGDAGPGEGAPASRSADPSKTHDHAISSLNNVLEKLR